MQKVLIVEDDRFWQQVYRERLAGKVTVIRAFTILEAEDYFKVHEDISVIVMDACVPGETPTTLDLTKRFRNSFKGPMIAASSDPEYRSLLMEEGCDHESTKDLVSQKVFTLLGIEG